MKFIQLQSGDEIPLKSDLKVRFPDVNDPDLPQDEEWCLVANGKGEERIRFHDYHEIYSVRGLYEHIFYDKLKCQSPQFLSALLAHEVTRVGQQMSDLRVFDVGAGNGIMAEALRLAGAPPLVGVDIIEEAKLAAERDRPDAYKAYYAVDMTDMPAAVEQALGAESFNCLTLVAALGFGDIPPEVFATAFNLIEDNGWIVFNIKDKFVQGGDNSGFAELIQHMTDTGIFVPTVEARYVHRRSITNEDLYYTAFVGRKKRDLAKKYLA
jgi:predicted TPR repeat methyltransferase